VHTAFPSAFGGLILRLLAVAMVATAAGCRRAPELPAARPEDRYLVGAHYYRWYPSNFDKGYLRARLNPPQEPALGRYASDDVRTVEQQIAWCSEFGIDFLTLDWWPRREAGRDPKAPDVFLQAANIADIRFCIFYETWSLAFNPKTGATEFTDDTVQAFRADMRRLAGTYFSHPSYLRVDGRPVIILYLTRTLAGRYAEAMAGMRDDLSALGFHPYVIADEVFWNIIADHPGRKGQPRGAKRPQMDRIRLFDAVTAYNAYDWSRSEHAGYGDSSRFVEDVGRLYQQYRRAVSPERAFVPGILPGYNDRGVRRRSDHFVIPRQWGPGQPETSFLRESFRRLAFPNLDPRLNMLLITSFNEWNEDTAIEPLRAAPPTARDQTESGREYTQGHAYEGFGTQHLAAVRDAVIAVSGRVSRPDGAPAAGVSVEASAGGRVVARDASDSRGVYTLSRLRMPAGVYTVGIAGRSGVRVSVTGETCVAGVDLVGPP
jgi:hypothetical protein